MSRQLRAVAHLVAEQWRYYAVGSLLVLVGILVGLAYPWYVQKLIDEGVMGGHADRLNRIGLILLALLLVEGVSIPIREYFFNMAAERVTARLRQLAFNHLLRQDISFFDHHKTGELTTRLWADVPAITRVRASVCLDSCVSRSSERCARCSAFVPFSPRAEMAASATTAPILRGVRVSIFMADVVVTA